ncbi:hypothetical protein L873DRAFT_1919216 [Choiromyces venosus 120613-1]|uniref:Tc1-like transposase DDE domain-containing protein n=1 Tax=Choiromyces venosus 120613-1 TaxID=1336337 RepID=A0A3N4JGR9_9PEZI|nr:hypothetical protein L873DRAFT_1919216 [Choiromyces venosus 120613-1]
MKDCKYSWAPIGVQLQEQHSQKQSQRQSILQAYMSCRDYIAYEIVQGSFIKELFLQFLQTKVLPLCNHYDPQNPLPNFVLIMDNILIH